MGPLPLDNAIISAPLARNAKFHSPLLLSVRQSKLRKGPRRPLGPPPAPCESDPTIDPPQTISYVLVPPRPYSTWDLTATFKIIYLPLIVIKTLP